MRVGVVAAFVTLAVFVVQEVRSAQPSTRPIDVVELSVADAQRRMTAGTLTSRALTQAYLDRIAAIDSAAARWPGLFLTGSAFRGVGIPDCVADARATAARALTLELS